MSKKEELTSAKEANTNNQTEHAWGILLPEGGCILCFWESKKCYWTKIENDANGLPSRFVNFDGSPLPRGEGTLKVYLLLSFLPPEEEIQKKIEEIKREEELKKIA